MQSAVDATALMLSKEAANLTTAEIASKATSYFNALFNRTDVNNVSITPTYTTTGGSQVVITATGTMPTTILKAIGFANLNIDVASTVKWGNTRLRVALGPGQHGFDVECRQARRPQDRHHQSARPAPDRRREGWRRLCVDHSIREGCRGRSDHQHQRELDRLDGLGSRASGARHDQERLEAELPGTQIGPARAVPSPATRTGSSACRTRPAARSVSTISSSGSTKGYICPGTDNGKKLSWKNGIEYNGCYTSERRR